MFSRAWMDKENAAALLEALKRYRRAINANTGEAGTPLHDSAAHGSDAWRYLATVADRLSNDTPPPPARVPPRTYYGPNAWMS
jgi:phage terminase large subunit